VPLVFKSREGKALNSRQSAVGSWQLAVGSWQLAKIQVSGIRGQP
jgi:hypothetical protein